MTHSRVWTFFYGSFINFDVLKQVDVRPDWFEVGRLAGWDIRIGPLATLVRSELDCVYGILVQATHDELVRLYSQDWVRGLYLPEPVLVETLDGRWRAALCYVAPAMEPRPAAGDYVDRIAGPARDYGFPEAYVARILGFRPAPAGK